MGMVVTQAHLRYIWDCWLFGERNQTGIGSRCLLWVWIRSGRTIFILEKLNRQNVVEKWEQISLAYCVNDRQLLIRNFPHRRPGLPFQARRRCFGGILIGKFVFFIAFTGGHLLRHFYVPGVFFAVTLYFTIYASLAHVIRYGVKVARMLWLFENNMASLSLENQDHKMNRTESGNFLPHLAEKCLSRRLFLDHQSIWSF